MRHNTILLDIDLRLFNGAAGGAAAGGAAAGGEAGAEGATQAVESTLPKAENRTRGSSRRGRSGEFSNVVFGKQESANSDTAADVSSDAGETKGEGNAAKSGVTTTSDTLEAKRQAFRDLITGEYKDQYTEEFQQAFNRRFKETKSMEQSLNAQKPIMDMLMQRYNIADGDLAKLQTAIEEDNVYWEDAADKAGLTVEQFKAMQKLERENAELKALRQRQLGQQQAQQQMNQWYADAEKVKQVYPSFDFQTEAKNRQFTDLLKARIPMQQAYELVHMDEIKEATARAAAKTAGQQVQANIQARSSRPQENGMSSNSAVITRSDVGSLTRAERAEVARRASRGEKITF